MESVQIQAWKPKRAKRRVALPIVALVNSALVAIGIASSAFIYHRLLTSPPAQVATLSPSVRPPAIDLPAVKYPSPAIETPRPAAPVEVETEPAVELPPVDISKPQREPRPVAPLLEAIPEAIAATVIVDVSTGRQTFDLPGEGRLHRIARIEGFPGQPIMSPSNGSLTSGVDIQPLSDRAVYLEVSNRSERLSIETKSALPQFDGRLSAERVAKVRDEATKRFEVASMRKAAILAEINAIDAFLKNGQPKKLSVYGQSETQKTILRTNLEVIEIAVDSAREEMEQAKRVYDAIVYHLPKMRIIITEKLNDQ